MAKVAVIQTGGKQYLVKENDELIVDKLAHDGKKEIELEALALIDTEKNDTELGNPLLKSPIKAVVVEDIKGDKLRIAKFKSKVRYRRVTGFRASYTKIKIGSI